MDADEFIRFRRAYVGQSKYGFRVLATPVLCRLTLQFGKNCLLTRLFKPSFLGSNKYSRWLWFEGGITSLDITQGTQPK